MNQVGPADISVCIVAHNEQHNLAIALESVRGWAAELVVVDAGSSDGTAAVATAAGARVLAYPNSPIPESLKNIAIDAATSAWVFLLDPDEAVTTALKDEVSQLIAGNPAQAGFKAPRRNYYFGVPLAHGGNYPDHQLRLFRRGAARFPARGWHERVQVDGPVGQLHNPFDHHPYPDFGTWLTKFDWYTAYEARMLEARGVRITPGAIRRYMITRPMRRWLSRLFVKRGLRDGVPGVLAATFDLMTRVVGFGRYWMQKKDEKI